MLGKGGNIFGWWGRGESSLLAGLKQALEDTASKVVVGPTVSGRIKTPASILAKMRARGIAAEEVHDKIGLRVIVENRSECYDVLEAVHSRWRPVRGMYKDYIRRPKPNGYQSLHTVVTGPGSVPFEVQIRTEEMHRLCERGPAAHRLYKAGQLLMGLDDSQRQPSAVTH